VGSSQQRVLLVNIKRKLNDTLGALIILHAELP
jgi:hypothetical protein